ncbi:MAG: hypothetical protein AB8I08_39555 [Sandaracinaceae bacterium]
MTEWKKLTVADGSTAARVPRLITKLTSPREPVRIGAFNELAASLYRVGEWLAVGEAAVPLLLDVALGRSARRYPAFWLLTNILCGHHIPVVATGRSASSGSAARVAKLIGLRVERLCRRGDRSGRST